jgi:hypothetical protein
VQLLHFSGHDRRADARMAAVGLSQDKTGVSLEQPLGSRNPQQRSSRLVSATIGGIVVAVRPAIIIATTRSCNRRYISFATALVTVALHNTADTTCALIIKQGHQLSNLIVSPGRSLPCSCGRKKPGKKKDGMCRSVARAAR